MTTFVSDNFKTMRSCIKMAADRAGRPHDEVQLVAVSKQQAPEKIQAALNAGQRLFGENRVQEAQDHWPEDLRAKYPDLQLHLIGPLQTNKAKAAVALFDVIETIDRPAIADEVAKEIEKQNRAVFCLVQVNTGAEPQKAGVLPDQLPALLQYCQSIGLVIDGLMCIPPLDADPRTHFKMLRDMADAHGLWQLSMGMSDDFEIGIEEGATYVRVGSALFGDRQPRKEG